MPPKFVITCLGPSLSPTPLRKITAQLSDDKISTLKMVTLADKNPECVEITVTSNQTIDPDHLMSKLLQLTTPFGVDVIVQESGPAHQEKRLIVLDMDSTLIQVEVIDELAKEAGIGDKVSSITHRAMNGELSFKESLYERVHLLKGLSLEVLEAVYDRMPFTPGAKTLLLMLKNRGLRTGILSGGFDYFTSRVKASLELDYAYSNHLEIKDGIITGRVLGEVIDGKKKAALMEEIAHKENIHLKQIIAIGDGANDLPMIKRAGLGIAFNAKPSVQAAARYNISQESLLSVLYLLGFSEKEIEAFTLNDGV